MSQADAIQDAPAVPAAMAPIISWLLTVAVTCALGLGAWAISSTANLRERMSVSEERASEFERKFDRMDAKIDRVLEKVSK